MIEQDEINMNKDSTKDRIEKLKMLFPEAINGDGLIDSRAVADILGIGYVSDSQGYELNFAGKGLAKIKADTPTNKELQIEGGWVKSKSKKNKEQSKNFDTTENLIIRGDNLDALKILRQNYTGKIKVIYIDPPYNTDNAHFIYQDSFKESEADLVEKYEIDKDAIDFFENIFGSKSHSGWLFNMYPRIKIARDLMSDDGAIFISISEKELANLKLICDEILGESNFLYALAVVNCLNGNDNRSGMMETQEWCLIYQKSSAFSMGTLDVDEDKVNTEWEEDEKGWWKEGANIKSSGINAPKHKRENLFFPIFINEETLDFSTEKNEKYSHEIFPLGKKGEKLSWSWSQKKFKNDRDEVIVKKTKNGYSLLKKQRPDLGDMPTKRGKTTFYKPSYSTATATEEIKRLFDDQKVFETTKSINLIEDLIRLGNASKDSIVLDFFAGSGTTAQAVMNLNQEDGGARKFILVQNDDPISPKNVDAFKFCKKNKLEPIISSVCIERVNRAGNNIAEGLLTIDIGYKVFSLVDKPVITSNTKEQIQMIVNRRTSGDTLHNMMVATGHVMLTSPIEEIEKNLAYKIEDCYFILGNCKIKTSEMAGNRIYIDRYSDIHLEQWLNLTGIEEDMVKVL